MYFFRYTMHIFMHHMHILDIQCIQADVIYKLCIILIRYTSSFFIHAMYLFYTYQIYIFNTSREVAFFDLLKLHLGFYGRSKTNPIVDVDDVGCRKILLEKRKNIVLNLF